MILYEVTLQPEPAIEAEYLRWLAPHMKEVVKIGGFIGARLFQADNGQYVVQYESKSESQLAQYLDEHAPKLRQEAVLKFGNQFKATRRILRARDL